MALNILVVSPTNAMMVAEVIAESPHVLYMAHVLEILAPLEGFKSSGRQCLHVRSCQIPTDAWKEKERCAELSAAALGNMQKVQRQNSLDGCTLSRKTPLMCICP